MWAVANEDERPWFDWVVYDGPDGFKQIGRARAVVAAINGTVQRTVVVEKATTAEAENDCPFSAYGCTRLRWVHQDGAASPSLEAVPLDKIREVLCVEHDWEDWTAREGLEHFPTALAANAADLHERGFFVNAFAR